MCTYFKIESGVAQKLMDDFLSNFDFQKTFPQKGFSLEKNYEKLEAWYAEVNDRAEAVTGSYS